MRTSNQLRSDISVVGRGLTGDKTLRYVWGGVPAGAHAAYSFEENAVFLPFIDQEYLTDEQISCLKGWDRHERLHWEKSCPKYMKQEYHKLNSLEQELMQRLEDSRNETGNVSMTATEMERRRVHGGDDFVLVEAGNDEHLFAFRMSEYEDVCANYEKIAMNNRWGYLAMALQFKVAGYGDFPIPEDLQSFFDIGWKILSDGRFTKAKKIKAPGTWIVGQLAKDIYRAWQEEEEKQEGQENESGQGEKNDKGQNQKDDNCSSDKGDSDSSASSDQSGGADQKKVSSGQTSNDSSNDRGQASRRGKKSDSIASEFEKSNRGTDKLDPNQIQAEVGRMALDQKEKGIKVEEANIPYNMEDEDVIPNEFPAAFEQICAQITSKAAELKGILTVILRSRAQTSIQKNRLRGRINKRALPGVPAGKTRVMQKKTEGVDHDTDVQIIVDLSGSMWGNEYLGVKRSVLAACVCVCIAEALSNVYGINVEVIGFNSLPPRHQDYSKNLKRSSDRVMTYFFKKFEENYHAVKDRMGSMAVSLSDNGSVGGCNVDHEVIWRGAHRLIKRGAKRKIQFVLSDGHPSGFGGTYGGYLETELKRVNEKIQSLGVEQVAIGIQDDNVEKFYPRTLVLQELDKLDQEALMLIAQLFLSRL